MNPFFLPIFSTSYTSGIDPCVILQIHEYIGRDFIYCSLTT